MHMGLVYVGVVSISRLFKEELAWTSDKWLWVRDKWLWVICSVNVMPLSN